MQNHGSKMSISDKKHSFVKDKIGPYEESSDMQDGDRKLPKRRTKEERLSSALD